MQVAQLAPNLMQNWIKRLIRNYAAADSEEPQKVAEVAAMVESEMEHLTF